MDEMLGKLHDELENKKRFLKMFNINTSLGIDYTEHIEHLMDEIPPLLIPLIESHKHEDVWMQMKRNSSKALIERGSKFR